MIKCFIVQPKVPVRQFSYLFRTYLYNDVFVFLMIKSSALFGQNNVVFYLRAAVTQLKEKLVHMGIVIFGSRRFKLYGGRQFNSVKASGFGFCVYKELSYPVKICGNARFCFRKILRRLL